MTIEPAIVGAIAELNDDDAETIPAAPAILVTLEELILASDDSEEVRPVLIAEPVEGMDPKLTLVGWARSPAEAWRVLVTGEIDVTLNPGGRAPGDFIARVMPALPIKVEDVRSGLVVLASDRAITAEYLVRTWQYDLED